MQLSARDYLDKLRAFAEQAPGFERGNYSDERSYRADYRKALADLHLFRVQYAIACAYATAGALTVADLADASRSAFSGRLELNEAPDPLKGFRNAWEYTTGQYWPMEYRRAAYAVLASANATVRARLTA